MSETVLTLVRHGETQWNAAGRIQGHLDIPLNATGLAQAAAIGERLGGEAFDAILSSDLERALQTVRPIVRHSEQTLIREARLRERHLGVLQGLTGEEAAMRHPQAWQAFKARHPGLLVRIEELDAFNDFEALAVAIEACEAVVSVSNATAHFAGALGQRTFLVHPGGKPPFHYWVTGSDAHSTWYPSVEVVTGPDWGAAMEAAVSRVGA